MNDFPELIEMKRRANTRSLKEMALLLRYYFLTIGGYFHPIFMSVASLIDVYV